MNEQKVTLELTIQQLNTILGGLVKLPIEVGLDTFQAVQQQAQQQLGQPTSNTPEGPLSSKVIN
jgi:hypothetical protein